MNNEINMNSDPGATWPCIINVILSSQKVYLELIINIWAVLCTGTPREEEIFFEKFPLVNRCVCFFIMYFD